MRSATIEIEAHDDGAFTAHVARPAAATAPAIVLLHEIFGVNEAIRRIAARFAGEGYLVVVPDLYWRLEPGIDLAVSRENVRRAFELLEQLDHDLAAEDIARTVAAARAIDGADGHAALVGFCLGGRLAMRAAARADVDAAVSFYGVGIEHDLSHLAVVSCPLQLHFAGHDRHVPAAARESIANALSGRPATEIHLYPEADHGFFSDGRPTYRADDAGRAMERTTALLDASFRRAIETRMARFTDAAITVRGHDLADDLIGKIDAGEMFYLEVVGRLPDPVEARLMNALIVSLTEHGMVPSVVAARLTLLGAPESLQGAVAGGLLGVGDRFLGPAGNVAQMLQREASALPGSRGEKATRLVADYDGAGRRIPGLGHPYHAVDPRTERLLELQVELRAPRAHTELMLEIQRAARARTGRQLTLNAAGAVGAVASDIGIDWRAVRGVGIVARAASLVGHLLEEMRRPVADTMLDVLHEHVRYRDSDAR